MKTKILFFSTFLFIAGILMTSCADNAKQKSKDAEKDLRETTQQIDQRAEDYRADARKDWEDFKANSEVVLDNREKEIKDLRAKIAKADKKQRGKLNNELDELERKNKALKERITTRSNSFREDLGELNEKAIEDHRRARRELKHDMDELGKSIGDFFKRNTD